jgi:hypothetical protein
MGMEDVFKAWGNGEDLKYKLDKYNLQEFDEFALGKVEGIYSKSDSDPDQAFVDLLQLIKFINEVSIKKPDILDKLAEIVSKIKEALRKISEAKLADSYSISAGFPLGISVSLSWNTSKENKAGE